MKRVAAFDLGSNTLRSVCLECGTLRFYHPFERIVKTADGLVETGRIDDAAVQRVIAAVKEAKKSTDCTQTHTVAYATEALRRASNAEAVLRRIEEETGVAFEVIDGEKEARLTLLAVRTRLRRLGTDEERFVLVDIGGGSTELICVCGEKVYTRSFPVGIVTVAQQYGSLAHIRAATETLTAPMRTFIAHCKHTCGNLGSFVATAGTPTTVAAMKLGQTYATYDASVVNGTCLYKEELENYLQRLLAMPLHQREETVGVGRSELIAAGIVIFEAIYDVVGVNACVVIDDGLREGAALEACLK